MSISVFNTPTKRTLLPVCRHLKSNKLNVGRRKSKENIRKWDCFERTCKFDWLVLKYMVLNHLEAKKSCALFSDSMDAHNFKAIFQIFFRIHGSNLYLNKESSWKSCCHFHWKGSKNTVCSFNVRIH